MTPLQLPTYLAACSIKRGKPDGRVIDLDVCETFFFLSTQYNEPGMGLVYSNTLLILARCDEDGTQRPE